MAIPWVWTGAERVALGPTTEAVAVEVPLVRGGGDPRPQVAVVVDEEQDVLAVLDLAHGPSRVGGVLAARLGLEVEGGSERRATIHRLRVGDLLLDELHLEVTFDDELVLGVRALRELAVAVSPSTGVVRFVRSADADALLGALGPAVPLRGDVVPATLLADSASAGALRIRTDLPRSTVAVRLPGESVAAGVPEVWAGASIAGVSVPAAWWAVDEAPVGVLGELGADGLAFVDLAVDPSRGRLALAPALRPLWTDAGSVRVAWIESAARSWPEPEPADDLLARARWSELAELRWAVGDAVGALAADGRLAKVSAEHCELWRAMGERRLRAGAGPISPPDACADRAPFLAATAGEGELRLRIDRGARLDPAVRSALAVRLHRDGRAEPALAFAARAPRLADPHPLTTALVLAEGLGDEALLAGMAADPEWVAGRVLARLRGLPVDGDLDEAVEILRVRRPGDASALCIAALHDGLEAPAVVPERPEADCLAAALLLAELRGDIVGARTARQALAARWPELPVDAPGASGRSF